MPLFKIIAHNSYTKIYVWHINESFDTLSANINLTENSLIRLQNMKSEMHQCGFLSIRKLLEIADYSDFDLYYDESGKPHLSDEKYVSISHSHEFSAIIISNEKVGIDIEINKEKVLRIAPKFMNVAHLDHLPNGDKIKKATIIWGIKEVVFKIKNEKGISFPDHIFENEFNLFDKKTKAELRLYNKVENFDIHFVPIENYSLVYGFYA